MSLNFLKKINKQAGFASIYILTFMILIFHEAIYTPDTYSYLHASIYRSPGYVLFVKLFQFIFQGYFNFFTVAFQLLLGLFAVHLVRTKVSKVLKLHILSELIFLGLLIFPFFGPLRSEEHTSELQSRPHLVCRLLLEKKNKYTLQYL